MPHFFIKKKDISDNIITVSDDANYQHIVKSLRIKLNETLLFIDEDEIEYKTRVKDIQKDYMIAVIVESYQSTRKLKYNLYLAQSPLRSDAQITVMEKATELGVAGVYPIYTDNCAVKKNVIDTKIEKWQNTMYAASKQCERANIPTCFPLSSLDEVVSCRKFSKIIALCERDTEQYLKEYLSENPIKAGDDVLLIIGPEGGFSDKEFLYFKTHNIPRISLGDLILKAETAVITTIGNIVYESIK